MNEQLKALKERADKARILYNQNLITRAEAHAEILPYIEAFNNKSKQIAKKYRVTPKTINFASFVR
jgi:hypothetical protein